MIKLINKEDIRPSRIIKHHVRYLEIHGENKTIFMPENEHRKLHKKLRKEGKCNIPVSKLDEISRRARRHAYIEKCLFSSEKKCYDCLICLRFKNLTETAFRSSTT